MAQAQASGRPISPAVQSIPYQRKPAAPAPTPAPMSGTVQQSQRPAEPAPTEPAAPPEVTYRDGLLSVQAMNSSLGSVVTAIRNKTGIEFEGAENAPERVVLSVGPAPEGDVLSQIFTGSKYDYVAIGRPDSPGIVQRVILTMKSKGGAPGAAAPQTNPAGQDADEEDTPDEQPNEPQDTPVQPPNQAQQPQVPPQQQPQQQPKTPEQLLQELQQMQQQKSGVSDPNAAQAPRKPQ
jgi:hypothetical protein